MTVVAAIIVIIQLLNAIINILLNVVKFVKYLLGRKKPPKG